MNTDPGDGVGEEREGGGNAGSDGVNIISRSCEFVRKDADGVLLTSFLNDSYGVLCVS